MIYLDYAATTPMSEEAIKAFEETARLSFANTNSTHAYGRSASRTLESCRKQCLQALKLEKTHNLIFNSGASEGNSTAIKSVALHYQNRGKKLITCESEHPSVIAAMEQLRDQFGFELLVLKADKDGSVDIDKLKQAVDKNTILVSIMGVNNETGAISPIKEIGEYLKNFPKCLFHVDATQAIGKENIDYSNADLITCSAHKFEGPKGVGFFFYRKNIAFLPLVSGGSQEFSLRGGTVNLPGIASASLAFSKALNKPIDERERIIALSNKIKAYIAANPEDLVLNSPENASPYIVNFSFVRHKASIILEALSQKEIYLSSISACSTKGEPISLVLLSMGKSKEIARNSIRVSLCHLAKEEEIDAFLTTLTAILKEVRAR